MESNQKQGKSSASTYIILAIVLLLLFHSCFGGSSSSGGDSYKSTVKCNYCGKVIRSGGVNIHCTSKYNGGAVECDYCGHTTSIKK